MYHILRCTGYCFSSEESWLLTSLLTHHKLSIMDYTYLPLCSRLWWGWASARVWADYLPPHPPQAQPAGLYLPLCAGFCRGWPSAGRSLGCWPLSSSISLHTGLFTPVRRIVPGLSFSMEQYRPVNLHSLPQHFMLDYIFRVVPRLSFSR